MKRPIIKSSGKIYSIISNPMTLLIVFLIIASWFVVGIKMHFNDVWYKFLEGFIIITTLFMAFVIEHNQHADTKAIQEKLDELIKKSPKADRKKVGIEKKYKGEK